MSSRNPFDRRLYEAAERQRESDSGSDDNDEDESSRSSSGSSSSSSSSSGGSNTTDLTQRERDLLRGSGPTIDDDEEFDIEDERGGPTTGGQEMEDRSLEAAEQRAFDPFEDVEGAREPSVDEARLLAAEDPALDREDIVAVQEVERDGETLLRPYLSEEARREQAARQIEGVDESDIDLITPDREIQFTDSARRERAAEQVGVDEADIESVAPEGEVYLTDEARVRRAREQFEQQRDAIDFDRRDAILTAYGGPGDQIGPVDFRPDELTFDATDSGVEVSPTEDALESYYREQAADEFGVAEDEVTLVEKSDGKTVARARVEKEPDRPIADAVGDVTGVSIPTEREVLGGARDVAIGVAATLGAVNRRLSIPGFEFGKSTGGDRASVEKTLDSIPTSTTQARSAVEDRTGVNLPADGSAVIEPLSERVDATTEFELGAIPESTGEVTSAVERRTGVDLPSEREVLDELRESGSDAVDTASDVNQRLTVPGAGSGKFDPDADPDRQTGMAGVPVSATPAVATPPGALVAGAVVAGTVAIGIDRARRRGELGIGGATPTEVQEIEVGETSVSELDTTGGRVGTEEVGLSRGVSATEIGFGDFVTGTEVTIPEADDDVTLDTGTAVRQRQRQKEKEKDEEEITFVDVEEIQVGEELERQRRARERRLLGEERRFPTGEGAVIGREIARTEESAELRSSVDAVDRVGVGAGVGVGVGVGQAPIVSPFENTGVGVGEQTAERTVSDVTASQDAVGVRAQTQAEELVEEQVFETPTAFETTATEAVTTTPGTSRTGRRPRRLDVDLPEDDLSLTPDDDEEFIKRFEFGVASPDEVLAGDELDGGGSDPIDTDLSVGGDLLDDDLGAL